jgi:hypothetical protein
MAKYQRLQITREELLKLEQGYPPEEVCKDWDCATVNEGLAGNLLLIIEQLDFILFEKGYGIDETDNDG